MNKLKHYAVVYAVILLASGCSTTKEASSEKIFYPPPPENPRLQYLTSFSEEQDLVPPMNAFKKFIMGAADVSALSIVKPYGMAVQGTKLYVCDTVLNHVHILDLEAHTWEIFDPESKGKIRKPINISVDSDGVCYIADTIRSEVLVCAADGTFIDAMGQDKDVKPVGIAVSKDRIFIGDINQHKVHVYDKVSRQLLFSIPRNSDNGQEQLFAPTNIALDQTGNIYVSDTGGFHIQKYDSEGNFLHTYGGPGTASGLFMRNKGVAVDHEGILYAVDAATQIVQIFDAEGNLLLYFGESEGSPVPLVLPAGIVIDYNNAGLFQSYADKNFKLDYLVFVSNQYGPRKVAVYGFGNMIQP